MNTAVEFGWGVSVEVRRGKSFLVYNGHYFGYASSILAIEAAKQLCDSLSIGG